jgi:predicted nuclease of predicted toxin-antitoxin system
MAKFFADEDFPLPVIQELRRLGHDAVTVFESGRANQRWPDDQLFAYAQKEARVVLTHNRSHFKRLHRQHGSDHFGIVICTADPDFVGLARRVHEAVLTLPSLRGQLIRICRPDRNADARQSSQAGE